MEHLHDEHPITPDPLDELRIQGGNQEITLTRFNCALRLFAQGGGIFDHVVVETGDKPIIIPPTEPLKRALLENSFPHTCDQEPDEATVNWFAWFQRRQLERELHNNQI